ncbi:type II toxin-antitoxin system Y4mF family antitoxin [Salinicola socius]|uniref:Transcriptional regulator n=1 Tax=Salinicola socius TaxID=404433 RepID=A0A1Q8ST42_9GAMM|nr:type II toxin-antitoxin system Y4mF family antitoxin [Salinicola socius]OLO04619.1 transcriptional regulator [Salinicola socius]
MARTEKSPSLPQTVRSTEAIGEIVQQLRREQKLLQADLAGLAGTGNRFVVDLEKGKPTLQMQKVLDVLDLMGLEVSIRRKGSAE